MKALIYMFCIALVLVSCKTETTTEEVKNDVNNIIEVETIDSLEGTWELIGFYNYNNNKIKDSFNTSEGYRQVKMYTSSKVMWSKNVPTDSTEWFGYGSYSLSDNTLTEVLDYGSEMMSKIIQEKKEFIYEIDLTENTFSQIEIDEEGNRIYSENYKRIE
ncbi:hypothetical protein [Psychroserpens jangbogonensis]|uniref:hypothetical protein n=1 Tax=Psychroserpens jangbogonensis TaxID=1484460 RepID=UPI00053E1CEF|nr:hypothetical protein [Psychroserpens jangbogonensis]